MAYYNYPNYAYTQYPYQQQSYSNNIRTMEWVDGEVGAKAFQMPAGWPVNAPIALWDSSAKKIFLKSWNQMGMANPLQELDYDFKDQPSSLITSAQQEPANTNYVTKQELEDLKREIQNLAASLTNSANTSNGTVPPSPTPPATRNRGAST